VSRTGHAAENPARTGLGVGGKGEARSTAPGGTEARAAAPVTENLAAVGPSMEAIVERDNVRKALAHVRRNKGAPGIDDMSVEDLALHLKDHWLEIKAQLLAGTYRPQPVRRVEIPKPAGGVRALGIPTVLDRLIQQAVRQALQADWDPRFSEASFGFRPGRSAHQAVARAQEYIAAGYGWVVDIDLEKFFDRVNHDILMGLVAKRVSDRRLLRLIRGFLTAGVLAQGLVGRPTKEPRKGVRCRPCCRIWCSTCWIRNWSNAVTALCATPTTAIFMCAAAGPWAFSPRA
jgi:RNA-directed DNA polymerase